MDHPVTELEVAALLSRLRAQEHPAVERPKGGQLHVSPLRGHPLVEFGAVDLGAQLQSLLEDFEDPQIPQEDQELLPIGRRLADMLFQPRRPGVVDRVRGRPAHGDAERLSRRQPPDGRSTHRGRVPHHRLATLNLGVELRKGRGLIRPEQRQQPMKTGAIGGQGRRREQQRVPGRLHQGGHRRLGRTTDEAMGLVHDHEVQARPGGQDGQARIRRERLHGGHREGVDIEGVGFRTVLPRHILDALVVHKHEHRVEFPPQLAQPLNGQGVRRHDERSLRPPGPEERREDEAGLDGLPQPHLVGEQPANRVRGRGPLGGVQLMGIQIDAPAEEGAQPASLSQARQPQGVDGVSKGAQSVHPPIGDAVDGGDRRRQGP